jgi:hypothetical protein
MFVVFDETRKRSSMFYGKRSDMDIGNDVLNFSFDIFL